MLTKLIRQLEQALWPNGYRTDAWMVIDCARDKSIWGLLLDSRLQHECLYSGMVHPALESMAPHLVQLEQEDIHCRRILERAWGDSWGIFVKCDTTANRLRRHLRSFLTVRDPTGNKLLFRYYDPRVLRIYLPTCAATDLQTVFGPITNFLLEGETGETIVEFGFDGRKVLRNELPLNSYGNGPPVPPEMPLASATAQPLRPGALTIGRPQMTALSNAEREKFERWMEQHLKRFFPNESGSLGESKLRETIQYGGQRAAAYGLTAKRDVCKYIDVMLALGRDFDADPCLTWVPRILSQPNSPKARAHNLLQAAVSHLRRR